MASVLKVDKLDPQSGTALEIGTSGDTISIPSGATLDISASTLTPPATMPASSGINLTALNATNLGSGTVPTARLGTGSASSSVFLAGDSTWAAAGGDTNIPIFRADTCSQTVGSEATIIYTNSVFDSASGYNTSTGIYTIPADMGGYWWFQGVITIGVSYTGIWIMVKVEGSNVLKGTANNTDDGSGFVSGICNVSAGDEINIAVELGSSQTLNPTAYINSFCGFRLIQ